MRTLLLTSLLFVAGFISCDETKELMNNKPKLLDEIEYFELCECMLHMEIYSTFGSSDHLLRIKDHLCSYVLKRNERSSIASVEFDNFAPRVESLYRVLPSIVAMKDLESAQDKRIAFWTEFRNVSDEVFAAREKACKA